MAELPTPRTKEAVAGVESELRTAGMTNVSTDDTSMGKREERPMRHRKEGKEEKLGRLEDGAVRTCSARCELKLTQCG